MKYLKAIWNLFWSLIFAFSIRMMTKDFAKAIFGRVLERVLTSETIQGGKKLKEFLENENN